MNKKTKQVSGELIYGIHPIVELLKAKKRKIIAIYTTKPEPKSWPQVAQLLPAHGIQIQYVTRDVLTKMAESTDHQGVVAWVQNFGFRKKFFESEKQPFLLLLDNIQDTRNLGAILRSAYCTNVDGIIICKKGGAPINAAVFKASAGLAEHLEIYQASSVEQAVQLLQETGYHLYLAMLKGQDATITHFKQPLCLVIGNEAIGITKAILKSGTAITLKQKTAEISYNASVAAGILLFLISTKNGRI